GAVGIAGNRRERAGRGREGARARARARPVDVAAGVGGSARGGVVDGGGAGRGLVDHARRLTGDRGQGRALGDRDVVGVVADRVQGGALVGALDRVRARAGGGRVVDRAAG